MDHALQNLIGRGIWVRGWLLSTLAAFRRVWVSWHGAASEHNMHQRLSSNSLNCILMSWWLWRLFLNQIGALELHLVLIKLMHLPSGNVLREWKRDTEGGLFCLTLSQGLSFSHFVKDLESLTEWRTQPRKQPARTLMWTWVPSTTEEQEACHVVLGLSLAHCGSSDVTAVLKSDDTQKPGEGLAVQVSKWNLTL